MLLYDRWKKIAGAHKDKLALRDVSNGQEWTFSQLDEAAENAAAPGQGICFPQGNGPGFIIALLAAWRSSAVVCPLELAQDQPGLPGELPAEIVHLKTTSASTGAPRVVGFTAPQLMADAENIISTMGLQPDWPNLGLISLAHSYGFSNLVLPLLLHGIPLILAGSGLPEALRRAAADEKELTLAAVPALWKTWLDSNAIPASIRLAISAGAPLPLELEQRIFEKFALKVHNFYGSTECGGIAYDDSFEVRSDPTLIGKPMKNVSTSVGEDGCLEVRGAAVGQTYLPDPSPNLQNGVFQTTDLVEIKEGRIYFRGRACDRINVAGRKISPESIELVLASHPQVRECVAFGIPSADEGRGETIVACLATEQELDSATLKQFAMEHLPAWQVPREWWLVKTLQANDRGKLSRQAWRKSYLEKFRPGMT
jgi:acyl-CoA synthetase (AMP-forming)/AMP-acid ligase II